MSLVYIFTGEGKGKTSAALGMVLRAVGADLKTAWVAWYKDPSWKVSEYRLQELLGVEPYIGGRGFYFADSTKLKPTKVGAVVDRASPADHKKAAKQTLLAAQELVRGQKYDLIVLDEVCQAVGEGLIQQSEILKLLEARGRTHLVLTGRHCPPELITAADTVTEMKNVKHAYDRGVAAIKGLDF